MSNNKSNVPITLVIVDSGPLISLAVADRLDLLQSFNRPVFVTDVVKAECTTDLSKVGATQLRDWFDLTGRNQHNEVKLIDTPFGEVYQKALVAKSEGIIGATKDFGEYSAHWVMSNLKDLSKRMNLLEQEHIGLFLSEDKHFYINKSNVPPRTHLLSTRSFLKSLERLEYIDNYEEIINQIKTNGRPKIAKLLMDESYKEGGQESEYKSGIAERLKQRIEEFKGGTTSEEEDVPPFKI